MTDVRLGDIIIDINNKEEYEITDVGESTYGVKNKFGYPERVDINNVMSRREYNTGCYLVSSKYYVKSDHMAVKLFNDWLDSIKKNQYSGYIQNPDDLTRRYTIADEYHNNKDFDPSTRQKLWPHFTNEIVRDGKELYDIENKYGAKIR